MSDKAIHSPILSLEEGLQLYEAAAFLMWWFGLSFTVHITVSWAAMGIVDGETVMKVLSLFNSEAAKWLRVGFARENVQRRGRRFGYGRHHCYIGVHESGGRFGLHSHLLLTVPLPIAASFVDWSRGRFRDYSGRPWIPESAVYGAISNARNKTESVERHWAWARYLWKQVDIDTEVLANDGSWVPIIAVLKPWPQQSLQPLPMKRAVMVSRNLGLNARKSAAFVSRYSRGDFDDMFSGHELAEFRVRLAQAQRDDDVAAAISTLCV